MQGATATTPELAVGTRAAIRFAVGPVEMAEFARISGDRNPVHLDRATASRLGFRAPVVYGALIVARISRLIGMELPVADVLWTGLDIDFRAPLHVDEIALLTGEVTELSAAARAATLRLRVESTADRRLIARGRAEIVFPHG